MQLRLRLLRLRFLRSLSHSLSLIVVVIVVAQSERERAERESVWQAESARTLLLRTCCWYVSMTLTWRWVQLVSHTHTHARTHALSAAERERGTCKSVIEIVWVSAREVLGESVARARRCWIKVLLFVVGFFSNCFAGLLFLLLLLLFFVLLFLFLAFRKLLWSQQSSHSFLGKKRNGTETETETEAKIIIKTTRGRNYKLINNP